jgi:hypothetical protein
MMLLEYDVYVDDLRHFQLKGFQGNKQEQHGHQPARQKVCTAHLFRFNSMKNLLSPYGMSYSVLLRNYHYSEKKMFRLILGATLIIVSSLALAGSVEGKWRTESNKAGGTLKSL